MPFRTLVFLINQLINYYNVIITCRKEGGFDFSHKTYFCKKEKASASASWNDRKMCASVTVEAVFCVPLFFYAAICLIWMLEMHAVQSAVKCGLQKAGKEAAAEFYEMPIVLPAKLEDGIVEAVGKERLDRSFIEGGSSGIHCEKSYALPGSGIMELKVSYRIKLPVPVFVIPPMSYSESMRIKGWNGYEKQIFSEPEDRTIVYITENGIVYHKDIHCTYLEPSVRAVTPEEVDVMRNDSGGKYRRCERCGNQISVNGMCYITEYGDRYHMTSRCSGLKRRVYSVTLEEVKGKGACSKCGK